MRQRASDRDGKTLHTCSVLFYVLWFPLKNLYSWAQTGRYKTCSRGTWHCQLKLASLQMRAGTLRSTRSRTPIPPEKEREGFGGQLEFLRQNSHFCVEAIGSRSSEILTLLRPLVGL